MILAFLFLFIGLSVAVLFVSMDPSKFLFGMYGGLIESLEEMQPVLWLVVLDRTVCLQETKKETISSFYGLLSARE